MMALLLPYPLQGRLKMWSFLHPRFPLHKDAWEKALQSLSNRKIRFSLSC